VTIKIPEPNASNISTTLNRSTKGIPLCFYGCPKTANIKPRSIDPAHRCPSEELEDEGAEESSSVEFMDTANSITSAICDSLANVQNILKDTSILDSRLRLSGEESWVSTQSDSSGSSGSLLPPASSQQRDHHNNHSRFGSSSGAVGNSAQPLQRQSVVYPYSLYRSRILALALLLFYSCR